VTAKRGQAGERAHCIAATIAVLGPKSELPEAFGVRAVGRGYHPQLHRTNSRPASPTKRGSHGSPGDCGRGCVQAAEPFRGRGQSVEDLLAGEEFSGTAGPTVTKKTATTMLAPQNAIGDADGPSSGEVWSRGRGDPPRSEMRKAGKRQLFRRAGRNYCSAAALINYHSNVPSPENSSGLRILRRL
jgi:hypothetical protein